MRTNINKYIPMRPQRVYRLVVAILYIVLGFYIAIKFGMQPEPNAMLVFFGIIMIIYGLFRGFRGLKNKES